MVTRVSQLVQQLPGGLKAHIEQQPIYTPAEHEAWRFIRGVMHPFLVEHAHPAYLDAEQIGISSEKIPLIASLDEKLYAYTSTTETPMGVVGVNGYSNAFLALQYFGVLPVSIDMRLPSILWYTPSPDITHEGFGHTVMLTNPTYRKILKTFAELSVLAESAPEDAAYFNAVRKHAILSEDPKTLTTELQAAESKVKDAYRAAATRSSESFRLSSMYWWTVEYGLVQHAGETKIWGAGLFSSIEEGQTCLDATTYPHLPLTLDTQYQHFDITQRQPQYFVARDLEHVLAVLEEFRSTMKDMEITKTHLAKVRSIPPPEAKTHTRIYSSADKELHTFYALIQEMRSRPDSYDEAVFAEIAGKHDIKFSTDWLSLIGLYEIALDHQSPLVPVLKSRLEHFKEINNPKLAMVIEKSMEHLAYIHLFPTTTTIFK